LISQVESLQFPTQVDSCTHEVLLEQLLSCEQQSSLSHWVHVLSEDEAGHVTVLPPAPPLLDPAVPPVWTVVPPVPPLPPDELHAELQELLRQLFQLLNAVTPEGYDVRQLFSQVVVVQLEIQSTRARHPRLSMQAPNWVQQLCISHLVQLVAVEEIEQSTGLIPQAPTQLVSRQPFQLSS